MKNTIKNKIAAWGLAATIAVGGFQYMKNSYSVKAHVLNPVILEQVDSIKLLRCDQGLLRKVTDGPGPEVYTQVYVKKNKFRIIRDVDDSAGRPYLVLEKNKLPEIFNNNYKATLHLRENDKIPEYQPRGIVGHLEMKEYGTVRCPDWQWKDQK
jgi:hypothetical protein